MQVLKIEIYKTSHFFRKETISSLLYVVVAIPIIEELCFRYPLKKTKYGISLFVSYTFYLFFGNIVGFKYDNPYVLLIAIFVLTALIIKFSKFNTSKIYANPKTLLYILSSVFGFIHIFNFTITLKFFIILPFIILPYIFAGLLLSYLRMKFSLFHSIIFHALMNGSVLIPKFIFENVR